MKRISAGVVAAVLAACLGLTTFGFLGVASAHGSKKVAKRGVASRAKVVAQATAPSTAPPAPSVQSGSSGEPAPLPGTPEPQPPTTVPVGPTAVPAASGGAIPSPDFGSPPSSEIPILFNDRHVYSKPDRLHNSRVLAALVRGGTVLVPLRSMFEQMGAMVNYDPSTKTVDVTRPGTDVKVAVGKPEVLINGESRPLDVPPQIYKGTVLVPLRVLSESMGAYVQWVPDKRTVVVRYVAAVPATPEPTPPPTAPPPPPTQAPPAPTPVPTPAPKAKSKYERFVVGDYIFSPKIYNALSPGNGSGSYKATVGVEFPLFNLPWMLEGEYRSWHFPHPTNGDPTHTCPSFDQSCVTAIGSQGQVYVPSFTSRDDDFNGRFALKIADPRIYIGIGFLFRNTNYEGGAFETQSHGFGFGFEKLPDLDEPFSIYGSIYFYPFVSTNSAQYLGGGVFGSVQYRILRYAIGGTFDFGNSPLYLDVGYAGDRVDVKENAPIDQSHNGPYAGLGIHF